MTVSPTAIAAPELVGVDSHHCKRCVELWPGNLPPPQRCRQAAPRGGYYTHVVTRTSCV